MTKIDLDKARTARRESRGEGPVAMFGGRDFTFPPEIPMTVVAMFTNDITPVTMLDILKEFLGADQFADFMAERPSPDDIDELLRGLMHEYGMSVPESSASES